MRLCRIIFHLQIKVNEVFTEQLLIDESGIHLLSQTSTWLFSLFCGEWRVRRLSFYENDILGNTTMAAQSTLPTSNADNSSDSIGTAHNEDKQSVMRKVQAFLLSLAICHGGKSCRVDAFNVDVATTNKRCSLIRRHVGISHDVYTRRLCTPKQQYCHTS